MTRTPLLAEECQRLKLPQKRRYTVPEVAQILGVSVATVYRWCTTQALTHSKVGHTIRVLDTDLEVLLGTSRVVGGAL